MLKIEIAKCCVECPHVYIQTRTQLTPLRSGPFIKDMRKDLVVGCAHRRVCKDYLEEPLQALPAEMLFRE